MKILVVRLSSIGDIVLTTPVVRCLKLQLPGAEIHYLTKKAFQPVLAANPYIDRLHLLEGPISSCFEALKAERFDYVVDLHHNLRTRRLKWALGATNGSFNKLNVEKWLLVALKINLLPPLHIVDRYLAATQKLGIVNDNQGLDFFFEHEHQLADLLPERYREGYVAVVIGAQHATKRLPVAKLVELCHKIERPIVLLGGKADAPHGGEIQAACGDRIFDTCGKLSLEQSAFLVKCAEKVVTHDTGLMHIAAAFDKPIASVWGNTVPAFGMYPYKVTNSMIAEVAGLPCRPCSKIGHKKCPKGHFKCMNNIPLDAIASWIHQPL